MNARYGSTERRRLVVVASSVMRESSHSPLGQRWWDLTLACGHIVERAVSYAPRRRHLTYGPGRARSKRDVLPAPRRARCDECPEVTS